MKEWMKIVGSVMGMALLVTVLVDTSLTQGPSETGGDDGERDLVGSGDGHAWGCVDAAGDSIYDLCRGEPGQGYGYGLMGGGKVISVSHTIINQRAT